MWTSTVRYIRRSVTHHLGWRQKVIWYHTRVVFQGIPGCFTMNLGGFQCFPTMQWEMTNHIWRFHLMTSCHIALQVRWVPLCISWFWKYIGIDINGTKQRISQFADDTNLMRYTRQTIERAITAFVKFLRISGLKAN